MYRYLLVILTCLILATGAFADLPIMYTGSSITGSDDIEFMDSYYDATADMTLIYALTESGDIDVYRFGGTGGDALLGTWESPGLGTIWDLGVDHRTGTGAGTTCYFATSTGLYSYDFSTDVTDPDLLGSYTVGGFYKVDVSETSDMTGIHTWVFASSAYCVLQFDASNGLTWVDTEVVTNQANIHTPGVIKDIVAEGLDCYYVWVEAFHQDYGDPITDPGDDQVVNLCANWPYPTTSNVTTYYDDSAIGYPQEMYAIEDQMSSANPAMWVWGDEDAQYGWYAGLSKIYEGTGWEHAHPRHYNMHSVTVTQQFYPVDDPNRSDFILVSDDYGFGVYWVDDNEMTLNAQQRDYIYLPEGPRDIRSETEGSDHIAYIALDDEIRQFDLNETVNATQPKVFRMVSLDTDVGDPSVPNTYFYLRDDTYNGQYGTYGTIRTWTTGSDIMTGAWAVGYEPDFAWHEVTNGLNYMEFSLETNMAEHYTFAIPLATSGPVGYYVKWTSISLCYENFSSQSEWAMKGTTNVYLDTHGLTAHKPSIASRYWKTTTMGNNQVMNQYMGKYPGPVLASTSFTFNVLPPEEHELESTGPGGFIGTMPAHFAVTAAPNPFNPSTRINLSLPSSGELTVQVFDLLGRQVASLASGNYQAGELTLNFDASQLSSGIYFLHAQLEGHPMQTQKLMLVR